MENKKILIIAFHFPPYSGSSGYLRTLKFASYLPKYGYTPFVLSINPRAYGTIDSQSIAQIPKSVSVTRAFGFDTKKHLSIKGRYLGFLSLPDRYSSWIISSFFCGLWIIYRKKIDVIYSTYPIPSAHFVGYLLKIVSKRRWLTDFRDPMWDEFIGLNKAQLRFRKFIEKITVATSDSIIMTTKGIKTLFLNRYDFLNKNKMTVIQNGYDENDFNHLYMENNKNNSVVKIIHAGLLEQVDRNPIPFFKAVSLIKRAKKISHKSFCIELYAPGDENFYEKILDELEISDIITIKERRPYKEILTIMSNSDILLLFQGESCDNQIPAKLYEYLRIGKPIFALTSSSGETGKLIKSMNAGKIIDPNHSKKIAKNLMEWIVTIQDGLKLPVAHSVDIVNFSRENQTKSLVGCFDALVQRNGELP